jgi:hydrogen peroxide-dependent heme synthase
MSELAPVTLEGWYALHQRFSLDWRSLRAAGADHARRCAQEIGELLDRLAAPDGAGWSGTYRLVGGGADLLLLHFRETLDELADVQLQLRRSLPGTLLRLESDYTSVTETGLHQATADVAQQAAPGSAEYRRLLQEAAAAERASPHMQTRLYPRPPETMRYISFYPMSKRRTHPDNWYALQIAERSRLMREHGMVGRAYAGRIFQIITGSTGLDDWEWGVTLFAQDPLEFKRVVTEMRYDEATARFGEFGEFCTGIRATPAEVMAMFLLD